MTLVFACSSDDDGGPSGGTGGGMNGLGGAMPSGGATGSGAAATTGGTAGAGGGPSSGGSSTGGANSGGVSSGGTSSGGASAGGAGTGGTTGTGGGSAGAGGGGSGDFEACVAGLVPLCKVRELDTAEKMEAAACKATEFIPIPLTGGGTYGPKTIQGGAYGGRIDWNAGKGTPFANPVNASEPSCLGTGGLIDFFAEPKVVTDDLKNTRGLDYSAYTIFSPACMKPGEKYPVITWANGTCGLTHGYSVLLSGLASHGYVVIASNSTWTNTGVTNGVQKRAIDYAESLNGDQSSPLYQRLDLTKVGAMGHSQGAAATGVVASDPRVKSLILWNGGASNAKPFLNVSGDRDIGGTVAATRSATEGASQPGAWVWYHQVLQTGGAATGHLVLMEQPERVIDLAVGWWNFQLKGDATAKAMFVGATCGLCDKASEFEYGKNSRLQ